MCLLVRLVGTQLKNGMLQCFLLSADLIKRVWLVSFISARRARPSRPQVSVKLSSNSSVTSNNSKVTRGNFDHGIIPITTVNNESVAQYQEMCVP